VNFDETCTDIKYLRQIETDLEKAKKHYINDGDNLLTFLDRQSHTEESEADLDKHVATDERRRSMMENFGRKIKSLLLDAAELLSERFDTTFEATISSRESSARSELTKKTHTSQRSKDPTHVCRKTNRITKEKTLLEAKLNLLEQQKEVATLEAEIKVLEDHNSRKSEHSLPGFREPTEISKEKFTADFLNGQTQFSDVQNTGQKEIAIDDNVASPPTYVQLNPYASEFTKSPQN
jgi:hypothetical protein